MTPDEVSMSPLRVKYLVREAMQAEKCWWQTAQLANAYSHALAAILAIPADAPDAAERMRELAKAAVGEE